MLHSTPLLSPSYFAALFLLALSCPTLKLFLLSRVDGSHSSAMALLLQLKASLLPAELRTLETVVVLEQIEQALNSHMPTLDAAAKVPNASASSIIASLLKEVGGIRRSSRSAGPSQVSQDADADLEAAAPAPLSDDALEAAISRSVSFRRVMSLVSSVDPEARDGARLILTHGFDGECVIAVRVLLSTSRGGDLIAKRHPVLSLLNDARTSRPGYFNYALRLSVKLGDVPKKMLSFEFASETSQGLMKQFLQLDFAAMDWISAPHGLQGWRQADNGWTRPQVVDPADHYCQPDLLTELGNFGHRLFLAIGCADHVASGYTFLTLCLRFAEHLRLARRLDTLQEQYAWLERSSSKFVAALGVVSNNLSQKLYSSNPATRTLRGPLIDDDAEPLAAIANAEISLERMTENRQDWEIFRASSSSSHPPAAGDTLPLLSQRRIKGVSRPPPRSSEGKSPVKRAKIGDDLQQGLPPGTLLNWCYAKNGEYLLISGRVWNLKPLARYLGVKLSAPCWPFLLCSASEQNRAARCNKWGRPGHKSTSDTAHRIPGFGVLDLDALAQKFSRVMTVAERARPELQKPARAGLPERQAEARRDSTEAMAPRGGPPGNKGRGRGRGRDHHLTTAARGGTFSPPTEGQGGSNVKSPARPLGAVSSTAMLEKEEEVPPGELSDGDFEEPPCEGEQGNGQPSLV